MKRLLTLTLAVAAALTVAAATGAATTTIQITKNGFTPSSVTVTAGDTVTWHNADTKTHQVVADNGAFASPALAAGASWSYTAGKSGSFTYRDAYATTHKATLKVNAPPATLSLGTSLQTVIYGSATQLNGQVSNQLSNQPVTLSAQAYGKSVQSVQSTTTQSTGTFIFGVTPTISTTYTAHYASANSNPVTVNVAPRVGFGQSGNLYIAKVTSDIGYGGHFVVLQRRNLAGGWYAFKRIYLGDSSRATFRLHLPKGRSVLRLVLPSGQAGPGYVQGVSRLMPVVKK
jgi:plastocyanin